MCIAVIRVATFELVQNSLTIPWHITIFLWQFILFFQIKNKDYLKIPVSMSTVLAIKSINIMKHFWKRYDGNCMPRLTRQAKILGLEKSTSAKKKAYHFWGKNLSWQNSLTIPWHWLNGQISLTFFQNSLTIPWPGENFVFPWLFPDTWQPWVIQCPFKQQVPSKYENINKL